MKVNKMKLLVSSAAVLLPMAAGLVMWNALPESMAVHWGSDGTANGWASRTFAVFALPCIILALHWLCIFVTYADPKNKDQTAKALGIPLWICPAASLFAGGVVYASALGVDLNFERILPAVIGLMFVILGNYMPKCKLNHTIGIKLPWTLSSEENWNKTHRVCSRFWMLGGLMIIISAFFSEIIAMTVMCAVMVVLCIVPVVYSYSLYRKQFQSGAGVAAPSKSSSISFAVVSIILVAVLAFVGVLMLTGEAEIEYGDASFRIDASYWSDIEVEYSAIDSIEYRDSDDVGQRVKGLGSPRLQLGQFENEEFGEYTRYTYTDCKACVVLSVNGSILVIGAPDEAGTKTICDELTARIGR